MRGVGKETEIGLQPGTVAIKGFLDLNMLSSCKTPYFRYS
jgi:hypothetical protein